MELMAIGLASGLLILVAQIIEFVLTQIPTQQKTGSPRRDADRFWHNDRLGIGVPSV